MSRSMLGQIERGEANPSVAILGKLALALKVPAEILLENDEFQPLQLVRELDTRPVRLDGGKVVLRPSFPYDEMTRAGKFFPGLVHQRPLRAGGIRSRLCVPRDGALRLRGTDGGGRAVSAAGAGCPALRGGSNLSV